MRIPYVIDNQKHRLADVLSGILAGHKGQSLDVATAYFTVDGFRHLREGLKELGSFRLLLGAEPRTGEHVGLRPDTAATLADMRADLENAPFDEETLRLVEDLIRYLRRENVLVRLHDKGFLHAKCYLFYSDRPGQQLLFDRFRPVLAIAGSSNLTGPGLTSNRELNLAHKVLLDPTEVDDPEAQEAVKWLSDERPSDRIKPGNRQLIKSEVGARAIIELEEWFQRQWGDSRDFKAELIELLDASKFGAEEYTPYQVYMKALYEYFKDDLGEVTETATRSAVELAEFQENAVKKARKILARYSGVMIADSVGLGKTWIGKKLLEDYAYHMRQKALVICPASLRVMWERELGEASISAQIVSQEAMGRQEFDPTEYGDADVILVDESHNFRNRTAHRYDALADVVKLNGGKGRDGMRKKVILLTATPINNDLLDLYNQLSFVTQGDKSYFTACGIGDVYRYFLRARRESRAGGSMIALFNLLEEVVIRRTRPFIRKAYPEATIKGEKIAFPARRLRTVRYDLEGTYEGIYDKVVSGIESLKLAPYNLEAYKVEGAEVDDFEFGRQKALVGIFKSRYLKRFESSIAAFRISVRRALEFHKTFNSYLVDKKVLKSKHFHDALRYLEREDEEDELTPGSRADEMDASEDAQRVLQGMELVEPSQYNLRKLHDAVQHDIDALTTVWHEIEPIGPDDDAKLQRLKKLLSKDLKGKKVLVFSYYKDTARYVYRELTGDHGVEFRRRAGNPHIRRMDSGADTKDRTRIIQAFAPVSNGKPDLKGTDKEIDILISTDVLSEGQNLQDCGILVNFDLHWNPTRMVQRAGRIDRIGTKFDTLWIYNVFPEEGLERLLKLVESLNRKITAIDQAGFHDTSVLGETAHPRNFNTLRRIREEDDSVVEEEEQFAELASSEFLQQQLLALLGAGGREMLESLPDGIHSGLVKEPAKGIFFYFQAKDPAGSGKHHFWKYYDLKEKTVIDNRYVIANLIACERDTPRVVSDYEVFKLQDAVIEDILRSFRAKQALEAAPRSVDPVQQTISTAVQGYLNHPDVDRAQAIGIITFLGEPMLPGQLRELRNVYGDFQRNPDVGRFLASLQEMKDRYGELPAEGQTAGRTATLSRDDLRLICYDVLSS